MTLPREIEHGGFPTSHTRTVPRARALKGVPQARPTAIRQARPATPPAGWVVVGRGPVAPQATAPQGAGDVETGNVPASTKSLDTLRGDVLQFATSVNASPTTPSAGNQETTMATLSYKATNKRGTQAIYTGLRTAVRFPLATFNGKQPPMNIEIEGDFAGAREAKVKVKLTDEQKAAAVAARKAAAAAVTPAEKLAAAEARIAKQQENLAARKAKLGL